MKRLLLILFLVFAVPGHILADGSVRLARLGSYNLAAFDGTDIWGYVDPGTGKEYALLGSTSGGLMIIDVSDPQNPALTAQVSQVPGFDIKVWSHYVYVVTGFGGGFGSIVDLADIKNPQVVGSFPSSHNLFISDGGYMFLSAPGLRILDLNANPLVPNQIWWGGTKGHDAAVVGNRLFDFHAGNGTFIYDITDPGAPVLLGSINSPQIFYHHSGWPSKDGKHLFITDELSSQPDDDFTVWNIEDPQNPYKVGGYADNSATVHNLYVIGDYAFTSYYYAGFRVFDVSDVSNPVLVAEYDTSPLQLEAWGGAFGVYPFAPSGNIYVSDQSGLFVFEFQGDIQTDVAAIENVVPEHFQLEQNYPNPFNAETKITYQVPMDAEVKVDIVNILGQPVRQLVAGVQTAGSHSVLWDGRDQAGRDVGSGSYIVSLRAGEFRSARKMVLMR